MALTYPWKVLRPDPLKLLEQTHECGETRTETGWPVATSSGALVQADTEGDAIKGFAPKLATSGDADDLVIIDDDVVYRVQLKTGENPDLDDYVMISDGADGSVAVLAAPAEAGTNYACGQVVDYDPASGGICHITPVFHAGTVSETTQA